jgi:hypothetical protein
MKGYVVRATYKGDKVYSVGCDDFAHEAHSEEPPEVYEAIGDAIDAAAALHGRWQCTDVRIFAVAEDGSETVVPTYEEALALLNETRAQTCTPMPLEELPAFMQRALSESLDLDREIERLKSERDAEQKAWARLFDATETLWCVATGAMADRRDVAPEREARGAAKQALRDLGVDVDALLTEARKKSDPEAP